MGAWWYVRPRLHAALRFHLRREAWQARAAAAAAARGPGAAAEAEAEAREWGYDDGADDGGTGAGGNGNGGNGGNGGDAAAAAARPPGMTAAVLRPSDVVVRYVGRPPAASPATASFRIHVQETDEIVNAALAE